MSYKAIVIFYLYGGHDSLNMLIPLDNYHRYAQYRGEIAQPKESLIPLGIGQGNLAIHGNFPRMATMVQSGMAAPILGTGNLHEPTTYLQHQQKTVRLPPFLFSHSHQQAFNKGAYGQTSGWAGRILDAWYNYLGVFLPINPSITTLSDRDLASAETFALAQIRNQGENWVGINGDKKTMLARLTANESYQHLVERVSRQIFTDAIDGQDYLKELFSQLGESGKLPGPATVAAKLIALAEQLGHNRQIIHVSAGSYDTHFDQFETLNKAYIYMDNLYADFIDELRDYGVADQVVCVTASDFGRSLVPNKRGTDHGWGSNHLVWGEPVLGGHAYGDFIDYDDPDHWTNAKRMIPKLADIQTYATLASWFGIGDADIDYIFPDLAHFSSRNLGFMI